MSEHTPRPFCPSDTAVTWMRPRPFSITHVELDVRIDLPERSIEGTVTHTLCWLCPRSERGAIELDQHDLDILSVHIDGIAAAFTLAHGQVAIVQEPIPGDTCQVRIVFRALDPAKGMYFIAADQRFNQVRMAWTQGAMEDHSYWFPCFDNPNNLSTYRVSVGHREDLVAAANGVRSALVVHGDGWATTTFEQGKPHVLYLLNVVVGDFVAVDDHSGPVPITHYLPRGCGHMAAQMFRATAFAIRWLGDWIGVPYPWARYGHVVVHGFMWGGMENTTLTTINDRCLMDAEVASGEDVDVDSLVIHELVHQWFGDLLTMKAWSDIWLNESFATYLEARCTAAWRAQLNGTTDSDELALELWANRQAYFDEDGGRYRRALVTNRYVDAYELFDRVAYEKGSLILHALCCQLGEERLRRGIALYTTRHAHDLVETTDFRQALEDATGETFDWFFAQWVYGSGHPRLRATWRHDAQRGQVLVDISQLQATDVGQTPFRAFVTVAWEGGGSVGRHRIELTRAQETFMVACPRAPRWLVVDPDGELLAQWDEDGDAQQLLARLADTNVSGWARARAATRAGSCHPSARLVNGLSNAITATGTPELVVQQALGALGMLRTRAAIDALSALWPSLGPPRLRRVAAKAFAQFHSDPELASVAAARVEALAATEPSLLVVGELMAARGQIGHPGATPVLRAQLKRDSWNQRLRQGVLRGLGASGEAPAIEEVLAVLADAGQSVGVHSAALGAAGRLGELHVLSRERVRQAIVRFLEAGMPQIRSSAAVALAQLGDPAANEQLARAEQRELFGNIRRVLRECQERLAKRSAATTATAALAKRVVELEAARKAQDLRLEVMEKRLSAPTANAKRAPRRRPKRR